jgi:hypothetical protein
MYNNLYYIFTKEYYDDYSNSTLYLKDKCNKMKILYESKDKELKYVKKKYDLFFWIFTIYKEIFIQISINLSNFYIDKCSKARILELF